MDISFAPLARHLGAVTLVTGALTMWALFDLSLLAAPIAVLFVVSAFGWTLVRLEGEAPGMPAGHRGRACRRCASGCARCRERIGYGEAA